MSTPTTDQHPLDHFESALLHELRAVVTDRGAVAAPRRRRSRPLRWAAAAGVVGVGTTALLLAPGGGTPAYAVDVDGHGDVTVTIHRLADPDDLVRDLAARGIRANVTYPAHGMQCADGRYTDSASSSTSFRFEAGSTGSGSQVGWTITVPQSMVGSDQTLVLESVWPDANTWTVRTGVADGPVGVCTPVPSTLTIDPAPGTAPDDVASSAVSPPA